MNNKNIAYIVSCFPTLTETFILLEIEELINKKIDVEIFSLQQPASGTPVQTKALPLIEQTHYMPFLLSRSIWKAVFHYLRTNPALIFKILTIIISTHILNPLYLLKTLAVFPKSLAIGFKLKQMNIKRIHAHWSTIPTTVAWIVSRLNNCDYTFTAHAWDVFEFDTMF